MGCPILLGYAEKAEGVSKVCAVAMVADVTYPHEMRRRAMRAADPYRDLLERRATAALQIILKDLLPRVLLKSEMAQDLPWLDEIPADLEPVATKAVLQKLKDRGLAWKLEHSFEDGKAKTIGELQMVFTQRVWGVLSIADGLMHDMAQGSYTTSGMALAFAMEIAPAAPDEWMKMFNKLEEVT